MSIKYEIRAEVKFIINWIEPAKTPTEIILRDQAQMRLNVKAINFENAIKTLLELTNTDAEPLN